ncbi:hypothetical protein INT45_012122 [Circinella minor]|uniref:Uncharacterized protein n=1 Tax=Circinella minor TaxID=1195481 RepID=A0A8H7VM31_9FUNG|nr:hypothetical protein INT45_012122 [Circinella minor]
MAAATEKVIRHQKATTTVHPIKSEDLTASQFASYAGIKIQHEDNWDEENVDSDNDDEEEEEEEDDDEVDDEVVPSISMTMVLQSSVGLGMTGVPLARSCSDRGGTRNKSAPRIWDSEFWQQETTTTLDNNKTKMMKTTDTTNVMITTKQSHPQPTSIMMTPAQSYASTTSSTSTYSVLSEYSNMSSTNDVPQLVRSRPSVIHKGRFKIVLGNEEIDDENNKEKQDRQQAPVVEWRRKRSCTQ